MHCARLCSAVSHSGHLRQAGSHLNDMKLINVLEIIQASNLLSALRRHRRMSLSDSMCPTGVKHNVIWTAKGLKRGTHRNQVNAVYASQLQFGLDLQQFQTS